MSCYKCHRKTLRDLFILTIALNSDDYVLAYVIIFHGPSSCRYYSDVKINVYRERVIKRQCTQVVQKKKIVIIKIGSFKTVRVVF